MPLTQKELERYLWEQPDACEARGLAVNHAFFTRCCRYRRLSLGEYGIAPLANIRFWPDTKTYYAQVFVVTTGALTTALYLRAKRYGAGLQAILERIIQDADITAGIVLSVVLVCGHVEHSRGNDGLLFTLNLDPNCQVFTCYQTIAGVRFQNIGKRWSLIPPNGLGSKLRGLQDDMRAEYGDAMHQWARLTPANATRAEYSGLVVTADGVVAQADTTGEEGAE